MLDSSATLTLAVAGHLYTGTFIDWQRYARALVRGKVAAYKRSSAFGNQSLTAFFDLFRRTWDKPAPPPAPETFGLVHLRPEHSTQNQIIRELLGAAIEDENETLA